MEVAKHEQTFTNRDNEVLAIVICDGTDWVLTPELEPQEHHFHSAREAWDYWNEHFDTETGRRKKWDR